MGMEPLGIHANAVAVGGDIMLSDMTPFSSETPKEAAGITFSHAGAEKIRENSGRLGRDGEALMFPAENLPDPLCTGS